MALLSREDILNVQDIKSEDVEVPEWGGTVRVRGLTARQRSLVEATMIAVKGENVTVRVEALQTLREKLVGAALVDEDGQRLFNDSQVKELAEKSGAVLQRLFDKAQELSGMSPASVKRAEGNSEAAPSDSSGSD